uniref:Leucine-rich repeat-containing N-terminal plant-type domain-containing protein n=1 Tax=Salix viminalis TaxID=40686 RepID=A0A6N2LF46_SALVM
MNSSLGINNFTGSVPPELGNPTKLITLLSTINKYIDSSGVSGPIPQEFANLKSLQILRIGDLSGEDSSLEFLQNQKTLSILILRNCLLSGKIPDDQLGEFYKLQELDLSLNKLTGQVPESFQDLVSLQYLDVSFNPLPGSLPQNFAKVGLSMNVVGTSINANNLQHKQVFLEITMPLRFVALRIAPLSQENPWQKHSCIPFVSSLS